MSVCLIFLADVRQYEHVIAEHNAEKYAWGNLLWLNYLLSSLIQDIDMILDNKVYC